MTGWRAVTSAVHTMSGRIFAQLGHSGSVSHPDLLDGALPAGASPVKPFTSTGLKDTVTPRILANDEIKQALRDDGVAARNAKEAGFNGVEVHAANTYLIPQFLNQPLNRTTDEYGGSIAPSRTGSVLVCGSWMRSRPCGIRIVSA